MNPEKLFTYPFDLAKKAGAVVLWELERRVPSNPELPRVGANISIFESGSPQDPATPKALGHEADNRKAA
jgi:hypothetical protein